MGNNIWTIPSPDGVLDIPRQQDVTPQPWAKWLVRGPTNRVFYDVPSLRKAEQIAREELVSYPGRKVEIYKLVEIAENETTPVQFTKAENDR